MKVGNDSQLNLLTQQRYIFLLWNIIIFSFGSLEGFKALLACWLGWFKKENNQIINQIINWGRVHSVIFLLLHIYRWQPVNFRWDPFLAGKATPFMTIGDFAEELLFDKGGNFWWKSANPHGQLSWTGECVTSCYFKAAARHICFLKPTSWPSLVLALRYILLPPHVGF